MLRYDINSGPLSLIHDPSSGYNTNAEQTTPRSLDQNLNNPNSTVGNFRIKGFVNHNFVKPTFPRTIPNQGIRTSADDPKLDLKLPSPQKSVGSPQKSVTSLPKSVASPPKSASPVKAAGLSSQPASKGSARGSAPVMDGRQSHQSSQRHDLTSRSSHNRHQQSDQNYDPITGSLRSDPQPPAPLSPPHHPPHPDMNGYDNQVPAFDKPNGYGHAPTTNGHSHTMNGHAHGNGWAKERPSPRYDSQDHPLSYRSVNQHQGRNYSEDYESGQNVPIRNAHEKTQEQIRKETQQFLDRRDEERKYKEESQHRLREKQEEQRRTREMFEGNGPFGRPGAGAPNGSDNKKKKFIEEQLNGPERAKYQIEPDRYVRDIENHRRHDRPPEEKKKYFNDLRQQELEKKSNGHTTNGTQNPDMAREQDQGLDGMPAFPSPGRNGMSTDRQQRYNQVKDNLSQLRRENEVLERSSPDPDHRQRDRRLVRAWDTLELSKAPPYREEYLTQKAETGRPANRPLSKSVMIIQGFDPWGRGIGNPHRDSGGNIARYPFALGKTREGLGPSYGHFERRGISSPKSAPDTNNRYDENPYDNLGRSGPALKPNREWQPLPYYPFGKSGGGAPRKDTSGNRITQIQGLMDRSRQEEERMLEKVNQRKYRGDLDMQVAQNTRKGDEQYRHKNESQRDYAEIIDSYRARPRSKHHLPHSDISRARDGRVPLDVREAREYHEELDVGYTNQQAKKRLDRMKDFQESRRHIDKMATYWGRYGGGNRKNEQFTNKGNLENLINNGDKGRFTMSDAYVKGKDWSQLDEKNPGRDGFTPRNAAPHITPRYDSQDDLSPRYSRVTVDSHHANQYDYPMPVHGSKKYYEMRSPWAPH